MVMVRDGDGWGVPGGVIVIHRQYSITIRNIISIIINITIHIITITISCISIINIISSGGVVQLHSPKPLTDISMLPIQYQIVLVID